ncbi:MAG: glycosyltransferase family 39 protein, partial [Chloroflexota bacterium]
NLKKWSIFTHNRLLILLILYLLLTAGYNVSLPIINSDDHDETAHFRYIHFIAQNHRLPSNMQERSLVGHRSLSGYPPFYQGVAGFLFSWIDAEDITFLEKPSILIREIINGNWIFQTARLEFPYQGAVLLWHLSRLFSSLLGAGAIAITYFIVLTLRPAKKTGALMAAAGLAFIPRFVFMTSTISDDNMLAFLMAVYLFFMVRLIKGDHGWLNYVVVGIMLGLAITTKFSVGLIPLTTILLLAILARQQQWSWATLVKRMAVVALTAFLASGWWFAFVIWNFNTIETQGLVSGIVSAVVPEVAGGVSGSELLATLEGADISVEHKLEVSYSAWLSFFIKSFWEGRLVILPDTFVIFNSAFWVILGILGFIGLGVIRTWRQGNKFEKTWIAFFVLHLLALLPLMLIRHHFKGNVYETAQGRHALMPAAAAVAILLMVGWGHWSRSKPLNWLRPVLPALFLFWSVTQLYFIYYLFPHPLPIAIDEQTRSRLPAVETPVNQIYFDAVELVGYRAQILPGQSTLKVGLKWAAHQPAVDDYLTEIQLLDQAGQPVSGWIGHPVGGVYPSRAWVKGNMIYDAMELPVHNLQPGVYTLEAYLLAGYTRPVQRVTGRLFSTPIIIDNPVKNPPGFKTLLVETGSTPLAVKYQIWPFDFFDFATPLYHYRAAIPIAWEAGSLGANQSVRLSLVAPDGQAFEPLNQHGNLKNFMVEPRWPSGLYRLKAEIVLEDRLVGEAISPPLLQVENVERPFTPSPMAHEVNANFFNVIKLLGYNLSASRLQQGEVLTLSLQWESLKVVNRHFNIFYHLYDADNQAWVANDFISPHRTITWVPGQISGDKYDMWIDPHMPNGIYTIHVGFFLENGNDEQLRFPLIIDGQVSDVTHVTLGPIKVGGPPADVLALEATPQHPRYDRLGDLVELKGYDLTYSADTRQIQLALYWQSIGVTDKNYTTFVHLEDKNGQIIAQTDSQPVGGRYPTSVWDVGEVIRDEIVIPLPAELSRGDYKLLAGMYDFSSGERLAVSGSPDNAVLLTTYENISK